jgi:pimeloyl-ACP methyl ester carboxylesterase
MKGEKTLKKIYSILFALVLVVALSVPFVAMPPAVSAQVSYTIITGSLPDDGTPWAVVTPEPLELWNGTIILDLDGNSVRTSLSPTVKWLLSNGYAYGGTTRSPVGYNFMKAVDHLVEVRQNFVDYYGEIPSRTIAWGLSRGGFTARLCMEFYPDIFDGALVMSGGGAGEIAVLNSKLDSQWVLKTLVDPDSPLKIVGIPNTPAATGAETAALTNLVNLADSTPEGRARLALAAAVEQFAPWTVAGTPEPAHNDYNAQYEQLVYPIFGGLFLNYVFSNPAVVMAGVEEFAGGIVAWNNGVDYTQMLFFSGRLDFVLAMYKKAGLGLKGLMADLRNLRNAPRIYADPEAVAKAEKVMSYTGEISGPVMNVDNIGDPVDPQSMKIAYANTLLRAGNLNLLRIAWVHSAGHGSIPDIDKVTGFVALIKRLDTGIWGDTSPSAMNALADQILSETTLIPPTDDKFIRNCFVPPLLRPWDVSDWDSYQP